MKIENLKVYNFEGAFRGMRNPFDSWGKSDSAFGLRSLEDDIDTLAGYVVGDYLEDNENDELNKENCIEWMKRNGIFNIDTKSDICEYAFLGPKDLELAQKLILAGPEHRKFMREIVVSFDLTLPLYVWKEYDTYKVGTVANSCSTMHTLKNSPITLDCFELGDFENIPFSKEYQREDAKTDCDEDFIQMCLIPYLESLRLRYQETKDKKYWKELIRWLPEGWLQKRTITMSYENLYAICHQRKNHRLVEWKWFIDWVRAYIPYASELLFVDELKARSEEKEEAKLPSLAELKDKLIKYIEELLIDKS